MSRATARPVTLSSDMPAIADATSRMSTRRANGVVSPYACARTSESTRRSRERAPLILRVGHHHARLGARHQRLGVRRVELARALQCRLRIARAAPVLPPVGGVTVREPPPRLEVGAVQRDVATGPVRALGAPRPDRRQAGAGAQLVAL